MLPWQNRNHAYQSPVLEGHCPACFASLPVATHLIQMIILIMHNLHACPVESLHRTEWNMLLVYSILYVFPPPPPPPNAPTQQNTDHPPSPDNSTFVYACFFYFCTTAYHLEPCPISPICVMVRTSASFYLYGNCFILSSLKVQLGVKQSEANNSTSKRCKVQSIIHN